MPIKGKSSKGKVTAANDHAFQIKEKCVIGFGVKKVDIYANGKLVETVSWNILIYIKHTTHTFNKSKILRGVGLLK